MHALRLLPFVWCIASAAGIMADEGLHRLTIHVGQEDGDIRGRDHRAIQAAIDYVAGFGGGTVLIGPGTYELRSSVTLRDNVRLVGTPGQTILWPVDGVRSALAVDGDANQREITVADAELFQVGDRVLIGDERNGSGFRITSALIVARRGPSTFLISEPIRDDCMVDRAAQVELNFPAVGAWNVRNASVEDVTVVGNRDRTACAAMDGCRHGGIYLFECDNIAIRRCNVTDYQGDGISFQVSSNVIVEQCAVERNAGMGLHPGSGSQNPIVRRNVSRNNDGDGLFVCWRVKHGLFEENEVRSNRGAGISIGHKDTDNVFRGNKVVENGSCGLFFRPESEPMGAHRNLFERNVFLDNGHSPADGKPGGCIAIRGVHHDVVLRDNTIGFSQPGREEQPAVVADRRSQRLSARDNDFRNVAPPASVD